MNIANKLTVLRILLAFICIGLIRQFTLPSLYGALAVFSLAALTDFLDGYFARKRNAESDLGRIIDPIADKILTIGVFLSLVEKGLVNSWLVILIILREFLITGLRIFALRQNKVLEAQYFGKHKTVTQIAAIILILTLLIIEKTTLGLPGWAWFKGFRSVTVFAVLVWVAVITVVSGIMYLWKNRKLIKSL